MTPSNSCLWVIIFIIVVLFCILMVKGVAKGGVVTHSADFKGPAYTDEERRRTTATMLAFQKKQKDIASNPETLSRISEFQVPDLEHSILKVGSDYTMTCGEYSTKETEFIIERINKEIAVIILPTDCIVNNSSLKKGTKYIGIVINENCSKCKNIVVESDSSLEILSVALPSITLRLNKRASNEYKTSYSVKFKQASPRAARQLHFE